MAARKKRTAKRRTKSKFKLVNKVVAGVHYQEDGSGNKYIELGEPHGYPAKINHYGLSNTSLIVGCHQFDTEAEARAHYKPGYRSEDDFQDGEGKLRPHGQALVTYAAMICKTNGWRW